MSTFAALVVALATFSTLIYYTSIWTAFGAAYMAAMLNNNHALSGGWLALFVAAIVVDVAHWGGGGHTYRRKSRR